ncbi:hypothetical protein [Nocardia heshunensis]
MTAPPGHWPPPPQMPPPPRRPSREFVVLFASLALVLTVVIGLVVAAGLYWKSQHDLHRRPVAAPPSWGDYYSLAFTFYPVTPLKPDDKGFAGARCSAVGTVTVAPGDPVPLRQLTCLDDHDVSTWFTEFADPADLKRYVATHWVRERSHDSPGSTMALLRPSGPATPYSLAAHPGMELGKQTVLMEASGDTFDRLYLDWWVWAQIR